MSIPGGHQGTSSSPQPPLGAGNNPSHAAHPASGRSPPRRPWIAQTGIMDLTMDEDEDDSDSDSLDSFHTAVIDLCSPSPPPVDLAPLRTARDTRIAEALRAQGAVVPRRRAISVSDSDSETDDEALGALPAGGDESRKAKKQRREPPSSVADTHVPSDIVVETSPFLDFAMPLSNDMSHSARLEPHVPVDEVEARQDALGLPDIGLGLMIENMVDSVMEAMSRLDEAQESMELPDEGMIVHTNFSSIHDKGVESTPAAPSPYSAAGSPVVRPSRRSRRPSTPPLPPDLALPPGTTSPERRVPLTPPGPPPLSPLPSSAELADVANVNSMNRPETPPLSPDLDWTPPATNQPVQFVPRTPSISPPPTPKAIPAVSVPESRPPASTDGPVRETRSSQIRQTTEETERRRQLLLSRLQALNENQTGMELNGDQSDSSGGEATTIGDKSTASTKFGASLRHRGDIASPPASNQPPAPARATHTPTRTNSYATRSVSLLDRIDPRPRSPPSLPEDRTEAASPSAASLLSRIGGIAPSAPYAPAISSSITKPTPGATPQLKAPRPAEAHADRDVDSGNRPPTGLQKLESTTQLKGKIPTGPSWPRQRTPPKAIDEPSACSTESPVPSSFAGATKSGEAGPIRQVHSKPSHYNATATENKSTNAVPTAAPSNRVVLENASVATSPKTLHRTSPKEPRKPSLTARMGRSKSSEDRGPLKVDIAPVSSTSASGPVRPGLLERMSSNASLRATGSVRPTLYQPGSTSHVDHVDHVEPSRLSKQDPRTVPPPSAPAPSLASRFSRTSATRSPNRTTLTGSGTTPVPASPPRPVEGVTAVDPSLIEFLLDGLRTARSQCMRGYEFVFPPEATPSRELLERLLISFGSEVIAHTAARLRHEPSAGVQRMLVDAPRSWKYDAQIAGARRVTGVELLGIVQKARGKEVAQKEKASGEARPALGLLARMGKGTRGDSPVWT